MRRDFAGVEIANELLRAGMTKGTIQCAAYLARYAERAAVGFGNIDGLDLGLALAVSGGQAEQPFARTILGDLLTDDFGTVDNKFFCEIGAHVFGKVAHFFE